MYTHMYTHMPIRSMLFWCVRWLLDMVVKQLFWSSVHICAVWSILVFPIWVPSDRSCSPLGMSPHWFSPLLYNTLNGIHLIAHLFSFVHFFTRHPGHCDNFYSLRSVPRGPVLLLRMLGLHLNQHTFDFVPSVPFFHLRPSTGQGPLLHEVFRLSIN